MRPYSDYVDHFADGGIYGRPFRAVLLLAILGSVIATVALGTDLLFAVIWIALMILTLYLVTYGRRRRDRVDRHFLFDWCREFGFNQKTEMAVPQNAPIASDAHSVATSLMLEGSLLGLETTVVDVWARIRRKRSVLQGDSLVVEAGRNRESDIEAVARIIRMTGPTPAASSLRLEKQHAGTAAKVYSAFAAYDGFENPLGPLTPRATGSPTFDAHWLISASGTSAVALTPDDLKWFVQNRDALPQTLAFYDGSWWFTEFQHIGVQGLEGLDDRQRVIAEAITRLSNQR